MTISWQLGAALILTCTLALHLWSLAAGIHDLAPDEAHYWEWSRRLDWSYYSKGPLVAYLIALSTALGGSTPFAVRLPAVLLGIGTCLILYQLTREHGGERAAFITLLLVLALPLYNTGSMLMTTDAPLLFCWALGLYTLRRIAADPPASRLWWLWGAILGIGFLGKYTMLLALPCLALATLRSRTLRAAVTAPSFASALATAALLASPVLLWNVRHEWMSVRHIGKLAGVTGETAPWFVSLGSFLGGQLGVVTPLLLGCMIAALARVRWGSREQETSEERWILWCFSAPPLLFFLALSLFTDVEANWAAPGYAGAAVLTGCWFDARLERAPSARAWSSALPLLASVLLVGFSVNAVAHFPGLLPRAGIELPPRLDPTSRLTGWADLGAAVGRRLEAEPAGTFVMSESYQITSALAFYVPGQPTVYNINVGSRLNQYDVWGGLEGMKGRTGLYVTAGRWEISHPIGTVCDVLEPVEILDVTRRGRIVRTFSLLRCVGYRGLPPRTWEQTF